MQTRQSGSPYVLPDDDTGARPTRRVTTADLRILRSSRGSTVSRAERACAVLLPTASVCKMSTGTPRMDTIVYESMDNGSLCLTTPL